MPVPRSSSDLDAHALERIEHRGFHRGVGHVQLADLVPLACVPSEILLRRRRPRGPHAREPLAVTRQHRIAGVEQLRERFAERGTVAFAGAAIERPARFAMALHQPGLGQELQMARDARLRLAEDFGQVRDRELRLAEQREQAQARILGRGLEAVEQRREAQRGRHKDMLMSLGQRRQELRWRLRNLLQNFKASPT